MILIGGGGHGVSVVSVIESLGNYRIAGILDAAIPVGEKVLGYQVVGTDTDIPYWVKQGAQFVVGVGQIGSGTARRRTFNLVKQHGGVLPVLIASTAWVSKHAVLGEGTVVFHRGIVNTRARIGENNIINTGAIIEHDVVIGDDNHISTSVTVNGDCTIGNNNFLGCGSIVHHRLSIADNIIVGAGAVVVKSCLEQGTYIGVPARKLGIGA